MRFEIISTGTAAKIDPFDFNAALIEVRGAVGDDIEVTNFERGQKPRQMCRGILTLVGPPDAAEGARRAAERIMGRYWPTDVIERG